MNPSSTKRYYRRLNPLTTPRAFSAAGGWAGLFGREAPIDLEIGFGNGEYLARASEGHPERDFIGVEVSWNGLKRALRRLADPPRENARLLHMPASPALRLFFGPRSLSAVRCFFPIPWPNEKHAHKRLFSTGFLNLAANRLRDDGTFLMVTDHGGLARWTMDQARDSGLEIELGNTGDQLNTKYERKWLSGGQEIFYRLTGRKIGHPEVGRQDLVEMQPIVSYSIDPGNYSPKGQSADPTVVFGDFIFDGQRRQGLLATKVVEDQFIQEFFIRVTQLPDGGFKLIPAFLAQVYPTHGVATALSLAALETPKRPKWGPHDAGGPDDRP
ncbi:MAG: hypothetical protein LBF58_10030 [Deltaproteobacteria bacterium]|nr:hypothetical protein [Deltaproteobacteria bacterium]